jgi:hypothetical protein
LDQRPVVLEDFGFLFVPFDGRDLGGRNASKENNEGESPHERAP